LVLQEVPHLTAGLLTGVVHGATTVRIEEAEPETFGLRAIVRALEWLSHVCLVSFVVETAARVPMQ
jgi:hypothetical protein